MPRKKIIARRTKCGPDIFAWLNDAGEEPFDVMFVLTDTQKEKLWHENEAAIINQWIKDKPGTRPTLWWKYNSLGQRLQIGGKGVTMWEKSPAYRPTYKKGIPASWFQTDNNAPPLFESEASYLRRFSLLAGEERKLTQVDFEPVQITKIGGILYD